MENINFGIITGDELRHKYFAHTLSNELNIKLIAYEKKANVHEQINFGVYGNEIVKNHFKSREENEFIYFDKKPELCCSNVYKLNTNEVNEVNFIEKLFVNKIDYLIIFGSSLISKEILSKYPNKVINLHLVLSPYYRGSGTLFWPIVDNRFECIGSTIHLAVEKIDAGAILGQVRPVLKENDGIHDIGNKTIRKSIEIMPKLIENYVNRKLIVKNIDHSDGKLCLRKDLSVESIEKAYLNIKNGLLKKYLLNKDLKDSYYPIITQSIE